MPAPTAFSRYGMIFSDQDLELNDPLWSGELSAEVLGDKELELRGLGLPDLVVHDGADLLCHPRGQVSLSGQRTLLLSKSLAQAELFLLERRRALQQSLERMRAQLDQIL